MSVEELTRSVDARNLVNPAALKPTDPACPEGRFLFDSEADPQAFLAMRAPGSIRRVILHASPPQEVIPVDDLSIKHLAEWVCASADWQAGVQALRRFGSDVPNTGLGFHVRCRRSGSVYRSGCGPEMRLHMAVLLEDKMGWVPMKNRDECDMEVQARVCSHPSCILKPSLSSASLTARRV